MLKRVSSFAVALVMLLSMVCSFAMVSAATPDVAVSLSAVQAEVKRGETVTVDLTLVNHTAWASLEVTGTYDNALLEDGTFTPVAGGTVVPNLKDDGTFAIAWANGTDLPAAAATLLGTFTFTVKADADVSTDAAAVNAVVKATVKDASATGPVFLTVDPAEKSASVKIICEHNVSAATAVGNKNGTHTGTCSICGKSATEACTFKAMDPNGATCLLTCVKCGDTKKDPNGTHHEEEHYYAPTPTQPGKIVQYCEYCKEEHETTILEAGYDFPDMKDTTAWYYDAATFCSSYGLIQGTGDGSFAPTMTVSRAQAATAFSRMLLDVLGTSEAEIKAMNPNEFNLFVQELAARYPTAGTVVELVDVDGTWYEHHAKLLSALGVINGKPGGLFDGNGNITRQEFALLSQRLIKLIEQIKSTTYGAGAFGTVTPSFADQAAIPGWAADGVEWARKTGLMGGTDGKFNPTNVATRAELATLMMRIKLVVDDIVDHM